MPLFLFTGQEYLLLNQELHRWKKAFIDKYGTYGFFDFGHQDLGSEEIAHALTNSGMFSEKKLVVLRGIPADTSSHHKASEKDIEKCIKKLEVSVQNNNPDTTIICISYTPDKRKKAYKRMSTNAQIKTFAPPSEIEKRNYIKKILNTLLDEAQQARLMSVCSNFAHLHHECDKLAHFATYHHLTTFTQKQLEQIVRSNISSDNFALRKHVFTDSEKTIRLIDTAREAKQDIFMYLGMLFRSCKISINIVNMDLHGVTDKKKIASLLKVHPFAVNSQYSLLPTLKQQKKKLFALYGGLLGLEQDIKTGQLPPESFRVSCKQLLTSSQQVA